MTAPKRGDRVRVVLEGEVRRADVEPSGVRLVFGYDCAVYANDEHVVSVDILCPLAKVGDIIETSDGFDSLPLWAVVIESGVGEDANVYRRSYAGCDALRPRRDLARVSGVQRYGSGLRPADRHHLHRTSPHPPRRHHLPNPLHRHRRMPPLRTPTPRLRGARRAATRRRGTSAARRTTGGGRVTAPATCRCPRARHTHGTLGAYNLDRCRCFPCRAAHSRAVTSYRNGGQWLETERRPAHGARRRLQALAVIGWTARGIAAHSTLSADHISKLRGINGQATVTAPIGDEITRLYNLLWDKPRDDADARRCSTQARRFGWPPPMALDDDDLDRFEPAVPRRKASDECGSHAAFNRHRRVGTPRADIDAACRKAERIYQRDRARRRRKADTDAKRKAAA